MSALYPLGIDSHRGTFQLSVLVAGLRSKPD
jgi:hypothetical protein